MRLNLHQGAQQIHVKSWTSGKKRPPTSVLDTHQAPCRGSSCRSSSTHSCMDLHQDTCRVPWSCHWVLYFLSARPLPPQTPWSMKDHMVSTEHPSDLDAFIALTIKIDSRLREQEKGRREVVPPNQRGHSTMQPSPCFFPRGLLQPRGANGVKTTQVLSDEWQPKVGAFVVVSWDFLWLPVLCFFFPHQLTDNEATTNRCPCFIFKSQLTPLVLQQWEC